MESAPSPVRLPRRRASAEAEMCPLNNVRGENKEREKEPALSCGKTATKSSFPLPKKGCGSAGHDRPFAPQLKGKRKDAREGLPYFAVCPKFTQYFTFATLIKCKFVPLYSNL